MARGAIAVESGLQNHPNTDPAPLISPNLIDPSFASERQRALKGQDWWFWEITTAIVSLLSFFAIIAILAFLSEKPLSIWSFSIAPNALIAVFTTLSKTAVMVPLAACIGQLKWPHYQNNFRALSHIQLFDDSSRGPWGAFVFIWRMRVSTPLASIAALLVIIALGMEPFTQQVVYFPMRSVQLHNESVSLPTTSSYVLEIPFGVTRDRPLSIIQASVMSTAWGFYRPIEPTCRTGDCEWPTFTSLGLCSKCTNVTDTTARNCFVDNIPSEADGSMSSNRGNLSTTCEFISSNGGVVTFRSTELILPGPNGTSHIARIYPTILSNTTVRSHNLSTYAGIKDPMFGYIGVHLIPTVLSTQPRDPLTLNNSYDAQECAIYYCEKSYQSSETKDGLAVSSANVLSSQPLYALYPINQIDQNSTQWYGNQPTEEKVTSKYSVQSSLSFQFAGTLDKIFFVNMDDFGVSPVYMHLVGTNLLEMMENATSSITDSMRIYSLDSTTVEGKIHGKETYVRVTWSWLLLPAIIQFGGTVVLIWTMVTASQQNTVLWKSSVLALLLREVSIYDQDENNSERKNINILEMSGAKRVSEMDRLSEQYTVRLEPDDETTFMFKGHGIGSS